MYSCTAARLHLNNHNPNWFRDFARDISEANWNTKMSNDPILNAHHPNIEIGFEKLLASKYIPYIYSL